MKYTLSKDILLCQNIWWDKSFNSTWCIIERFHWIYDKLLFFNDFWKYLKYWIIKGNNNLFLEQETTFDVFEKFNIIWVPINYGRLFYLYSLSNKSHKLTILFNEVLQEFDTNSEMYNENILERNSLFIKYILKPFLEEYYSYVSEQNIMYKSLNVQK